MATEKWIGGGQASYTGAFATELQSLPSTDAVISSVAIDNTTNLDMFIDVSFQCGSVTTTGSPFLGLYWYPLLQDGSTYGDGRFGSAAAGPPPASYLIGTLGLPVGTQALNGLFRGPFGQPMVITPYKGKLVLMNGGGVALPSSGITCDYRTYNRQVA